MKNRIEKVFFIYLSQDKYIEISNLSWMNWDQVLQIRQGISTPLVNINITWIWIKM